MFCPGERKFTYFPEIRKNQGILILRDKMSYKNKFFDDYPRFTPLFPEFCRSVEWVTFPWALMQSFATCHWQQLISSCFKQDLRPLHTALPTYRATLQGPLLLKMI